MPIWFTYSSHYDQIFTQGISIKFLFLKCSVCVSWKIASQEDVSWNLHSDTSTFITRKGRVSDSTCALPLQTKFQGWTLLGSSLQLAAVHAHLNWRLSQKGKNTKFLISFSTSRKFSVFSHVELLLQGWCMLHPTAVLVFSSPHKFSYSTIQNYL